jgi:hypothetical protein
LSLRLDKPGITTIAYVKMNPPTKLQDKIEKINATSNKSILFLPLRFLYLGNSSSQSILSANSHSLPETELQDIDYKRFRVTKSQSALPRICACGNASVTETPAKHGYNQILSG